MTRARAFFRSRVWYGNDLLPCEEHSIVKCLCRVCRDDKLCNHLNCDVHLVFNAPGEKVGRYCKDHRSPGMVDVVNKTCAHLNCDVHPVFNAPGDKVGRYCLHRKIPTGVALAAFMLLLHSFALTVGKSTLSKRPSANSTLQLSKLELPAKLRQTGYFFVHLLLLLTLS